MACRANRCWCCASQASGSSGATNAITLANLPATGSAGNHFAERVGSLAGAVYLDANNDGALQGAEAAIAGVTVTLTGSDAAGNTVNRSTTTDATGAWRFDDLLAAGYTLLVLALDTAGFTETRLATAWRELTNQDIAASIIGFIRQAALGSPLQPYDQRVARAPKFTRPQARRQNPRGAPVHVPLRLGHRRGRALRGDTRDGGGRPGLMAG